MTANMKLAKEGTHVVAPFLRWSLAFNLGLPEVAMQGCLGGRCFLVPPHFTFTTSLCDKLSPRPPSGI